MTSWLRLFMLGCVISCGLWWWSCSPSLTGGVRDSGFDLTFATLRSQVMRYAALHHGYPSDAEGLSVLVRRPVSLPTEDSWEPMTDEIPVDPWGHPYQYRRDPSLMAGFGLYCLGEDGVSYSQGNDPDDVNSWNRSKAVQRSRGPVFTWNLLKWLLLSGCLGVAAWKYLSRPRVGFES